MRSTILWIALILWLILGYFYYNISCECCTATSTTTEVSSAAATSTAKDAGKTEVVTPIAKNVVGPLMYRWSSGDAITGDGWETRRKRLLDGLGDNQILEIKGLYRSDETNNTSFENLGLARASSASKLFMPPLDKDRIRLVGELTSGEVNQAEPFVSTTIRSQMNTNSVREINNKTEIRFPFNSTNKLADRAVESYLDNVADRVKKSGERIRLTGHTDAIASTESNLKLGQRRADIIKRYLVSKGVSASKITTATKGESQPIGDNSTAAGRAQNRRTELEIIK